MPLQEVCVESLDGALAAVAGGADRIELCADLAQGGTTPEEELLREAVQDTPRPVHVMVRPRAGPFVYDEAEYREMLAAVRRARRAGAAGIVFGILTGDGHVDLVRSRPIVEAAHPLSATFHRAFDLSPEPLRALDGLIRLGIDRVLTSGCAASAWEGRDVLRRLVRHAADAIVVMAGGGIRPHNVGRLVAATGVREVHASVALGNLRPLSLR